MTAPLVLSLVLDQASFEFFNRLRQQYFPPERNYLDAHLTLFHALPGKEFDTIAQRLQTVCQTTEEMRLAVTEVKMIGRGVAYKMECEALKKLHHQLRKEWRSWLTPQDQQKIWPHVTVQNKVKPEKARQLQEYLTKDFESFDAYGRGLKLWAYRNGPWELLKEWPFAQ